MPDRGANASGGRSGARPAWGFGTHNVLSVRELGPPLRGAYDERKNREAMMRRWVLRNRRGAMRHAVHFACQVVRERDFRLVADEIVDLSTSGMLVAPADPVLTGERLIASFRLPDSLFWIDV